MARQKKTRGVRRTVSREALLGAAEILIGRGGLDSTSIDEIVARAGVAKGTFYNHFEDKSALARQLALAIRREVRERIGAAKAHSDDPALHFAIAQACFLALAAERPSRAELLVRMLSGTTDPSASMNRNLRATLEEGARRGRLRVPSLDAGVAYAIGIAVAGMRAVLDRRAAAPGFDAVPLLAHGLMGLGLGAADAQRQAASAARAAGLAL